MRAPALGFLGVGWIGRLRLESLVRAGAGEIKALADPSPEELGKAAKLVPEAKTADSLEALLEMDLDGIVIATPSALHAEQSVQALEAGRAVFCQKPLARTAAEAQGVVEAARRNDKRLAVDFSYRRVNGIPQIRQAIRAGELGRILALELTFHNAYGPDKPWFYDITQAGGGCLMDLGSHLVDLGLWLTDFPPVREIRSHLYARGEPLTKPVNQAEDFALAELELEGGTVVRLACSWHLAAGREAVIQMGIHGSQG
ncbi:MAG: Gfo/Idh/MocA family oxidoreductase, partial [Candidatus Competibacteraceae bacterium]|nr:Gfo/Idh/MocA family oxidoreductase [Candidatus Competibacteraceae bacterium]